MIENTILQQRAINKLSRLKVGALFMEMGTGKTKVALDLAASKRKKCDLFLYICPCSVKAEIENERKKWQPDLPLQIIGAESIGMSPRIFVEVLEEVQAAKKVFIILDESLKIKNRHAKTTQRILEISKYSEYRLILNGTPLSKNVLDLYTQFQFLSPKILSETFFSFKRKYCEFYQKGDKKGRVKKQHNIPHLISRVAPYIYDAELELSVSAFYTDSFYGMTEEEVMEYEALKEFLLCQYDMDNDVSFFAITSRLQNYYSNCESKRQDLKRLIEHIAPEKVIVFNKFLASIPDGALKIIGDMNTEQRAAAIERFKGDKERVLYITYGCGAFGLNLQFCHNIIFADGTFNYAERVQAEARIYRLGQEKNVRYYSLRNNTAPLEKLIYKCLDKKQDMLTAVKTEISCLSEKEKKEWLKRHL